MRLSRVLLCVHGILLVGWAWLWRGVATIGWLMRLAVLPVLVWYEVTHRLIVTVLQAAFRLVMDRT